MGLFDAMLSVGLLTTASRGPHQPADRMYRARLPVRRGSFRDHGLEVAILD